LPPALPTVRPFWVGLIAWHPRSIRGSQGGAIVGNTHHASSPGFPGLPRGFHTPSNTFWEEEHLWETLPPASLPPGCRPGWLNQSELIDIFVLPYITIILLAHSKSVTIKKCEIKYEKNTILCGTSGAVDPAKRDFERTRIEPTMPNFRPGSKRALPAHSGRPIALPFWECGPPASLTRLTLRFAIAGHAGEQGPSPQRCVLY
jgi:hypothetical protein